MTISLHENNMYVWRCRLKPHGRVRDETRAKQETPQAWTLRRHIPSQDTAKAISVGIFLNSLYSWLCLTSCVVIFLMSKYFAHFIDKLYRCFQPKFSLHPNHIFQYAYIFMHEVFAGMEDLKRQWHQELFL